jgi:flavin reductase (DIM6/NTAB) family NADH-FMN oxidoreductase RutF
MTSASDFKQAMRHLAAGITIVATEHNSVRAGLTVTAVCSVSADPPTILVCISSGASAHNLIESSGRFSVNVLAHGQEDLAQQFSGKTGIRGEERFARGTWCSLATGAPILDQALISLDCRVVEVVRMATHSVFFGAAIAITPASELRPLLYGDGTYGTFSPIGASLQP